MTASRSYHARPTRLPSKSFHNGPDPIATKSAALPRARCQLPGTLMKDQPVFGGSELCSCAGMKRQIPDKDTSARLALTTTALAFSQFNLTPAGSWASEFCADAA